MNKEKEIASEIETTTNELAQLVASFTPEQVNTIPFENSWTPGQVVDHILKSVASITKTINGTTRPTDRNPVEKKEMIEGVFLNFTKKLNSPDFIIPPKADHDKKDLVQAITTAMAKVMQASQKLDLSATCVDFELPGMGKLTRLEWTWFIVYHTKRHIHQLKNIFQKINNTITH